MQNPKITVLMPVYNGEKYLKEAIESILEQTFADFEFLIVYDDSTDKSYEIITSFKDERIRLVINNDKKGLSSALNLGINLAKGEYIARMDCDDISLSNRFEKQAAFMDLHPGIGICGSWIEKFGEVEESIFKYPTDPELIKCKLFFFSALAHPSVIMRKSLLKKYNFYYSEESKQAEDFEFWQRCSFYFPIANIPEVLVKYRITSTSKLQQDEDKLINAHKKLDKRNLSLMGIEATNEELDLHQTICPLRFPPISKGKNYVLAVEKWLKKIKDANLQSKIYPEHTFSQLLEERWLAVCNTNDLNSKNILEIK